MRISPFTVAIAAVGVPFLQDTAAQEFLETPAAGSTQSGIGVISGWNCTAEDVDRSRPSDEAWTILVESTDGTMALTAQFIDGSVYRLPKVPVVPHAQSNLDGYLVAVFDQW